MKIQRSSLFEQSQIMRQWIQRSEKVKSKLDEFIDAEEEKAYDILKESDELLKKEE